MPSKLIANEIRRSLAEGETYADFAYLFDTLLLLRRPYNRTSTTSEKITGRLLCLIFPDKPRRYIRAMQEFRLGFLDISTDPGLKAEFSNCVKHAALTLNRIEDVVWRPTLYFVWPRRLRNRPDWWY